MTEHPRSNVTDLMTERVPQFFFRVCYFCCQVNACHMSCHIAILDSDRRTYDQRARQTLQTKPKYALLPARPSGRVPQLVVPVDCDPFR